MFVLTIACVGDFFGIFGALPVWHWVVNVLHVGCWWWWCGVSCQCHVVAYSSVKTWCQQNSVTWRLSATCQSSVTAVSHCQITAQSRCWHSSWHGHSSVRTWCQQNSVTWWLSTTCKSSVTAMSLCYVTAQSHCWHSNCISVSTYLSWHKSCMSLHTVVFIQWLQSSTDRPPGLDEFIKLELEFIKYEVMFTKNKYIHI